MKITYNHIIKFLLAAGFVVLVVFAEIALFTKDEHDILGAVGFIINLLGVSAGAAGMFVLLGRWLSGDFDRVLDKTVFKFPGKTSLIEELKSYLEEAQKRGDVEEIRRLKNSIELIEKHLHD